MTKQQAETRANELADLYGFDQCVERTDDDDIDESDRDYYVRIGCSQCAAVCINGVPCHETGCSNVVRDTDDTDDWDED